MLPTLHIWFRGSRLVIHLLTGLCAVLVVRLDFTGRLNPQRITQAWNRRLLRILNIRVSVHGAPIDGARVSVANHVSWLDIPLIVACEPTQFIAKSEIRDWPVAGWLANAAGTFYIRRGKGGARPIIDRLVPHLRSGGSVVLFPEGTTTDGRELRSFHARLFCAAIEADVPVQPIALRYAPSPDGELIAPFIGDDDLVSHILKVLRQPYLAAEVIYCPPLFPAGLDRDALAGHAESIIRDVLRLPGQPSPIATDLTSAAVA